MTFHRQVGFIFSAFCFVMLLWAFATPGNEDHWINVAMHSILANLFFLSTMASAPVGGVVQVLALLLGSGLTAYAGDLQPAAAVGTVAILLTFLYSRFQTVNQWVLLAIAGFQFSAAFFAAAMAGGAEKTYTPILALGHAFVWTLLPLMGVWIIWEAMKLFAARVLKISLEVHEINKTLMKKGKVDGTENT